MWFLLSLASLSHSTVRGRLLTASPSFVMAIVAHPVLVRMKNRFTVKREDEGLDGALRGSCFKHVPFLAGLLQDVLH